MTAEDVVLNYQYHMNPDTASAAGGLLSQIETVSADGNDRVIFKLKGANADWPAITTDYHIMIKPTKDGVVDAQSTIGTCPYIIDEFNPGVGAKF
jgi:peptide/nickel transport system substrate-binding protein